MSGEMYSMSPPPRATVPICSADASATYRTPVDGWQASPLMDAASQVGRHESFSAAYRPSRAEGTEMATTSAPAPRYSTLAFPLRASTAG